MEIPEPKNIPSQKLRNYLSNLRQAILGGQPIAGEGIRIDQYPGKGTMISIDNASGGTIGDSTTDLLVCINGSPVTVRFVTQVIPS